MTKEEVLQIKKVQKEIRKLNNECNHLVQQLKIYYPPLLSNSIILHLFLKFYGKSGLLDFVKKMATKTICLTIHPEKNNSALLTATTNHEGLQEIIKNISGRKSKILMLDYDGTSRLGKLKILR